MFLKVGREIVNTDHVAAVERTPALTLISLAAPDYKEYDSGATTACGRTICLEGRYADAAWAYFSSIAMDLVAWREGEEGSPA